MLCQHTDFGPELGLGLGSIFGGPLFPPRPADFPAGPKGPGDAARGDSGVENGGLGVKEEEGPSRMPLPEQISRPAPGVGNEQGGLGRGKAARPEDAHVNMTSDAGLGLGTLFPPRGATRGGGASAPAVPTTQFSSRGRRQGSTSNGGGGGAEGGGGAGRPSQSGSPPEDKSREQSGVPSSNLSAAPTPRERHFGAARRVGEDMGDAAGFGGGGASVPSTVYGPIDTVVAVPAHGHVSGLAERPANLSVLEDMDSEELMMAISMRQAAAAEQQPAHASYAADAAAPPHAHVSRSPRAVAPPEFWYLSGGNDPLAGTGTPGGDAPQARPGHPAPASGAASIRPPSSAGSFRSKGSRKTLGPGYLGSQGARMEDADSPSRRRIMDLHKEVCVCVCLCVKERKSERKSERKRDIETEIESSVCACTPAGPSSDTHAPTRACMFFFFLEQSA